MIRRLLVLLLPFLLMMGVAPGVAAADAVSLTVGADPTEDIGFVVEVQWSMSQRGGRAYLTHRPADGAGCAPNYAAELQRAKWDLRDFPLGNDLRGGEAREVTVRDPGPIVFCAYVQDYAEAPARAASGPVMEAIRSARASVALNPPVPLAGSQAYHLAIDVVTEVQRAVYVVRKPAGGRDCAPNHEQEDGETVDELAEPFVSGARTLHTTVAPRRGGTYLLCAYVEEGDSSPPEAVASLLFTVPASACEQARDRWADASQAYASADGAYRRAVAAYRRQRRRSTGRPTRQPSQRGEFGRRAAIRSAAGDDARALVLRRLARRERLRRALEDARAAYGAAC